MQPSCPNHSPLEPSGLAPEFPRRGFITKATAFLLGAVLPLVPLASGLAVFLSPIRRKRPVYKGASADGFFRISSLATLSDVPQAQQIIADRIDAWTTFRNEPIGTVYLQKTGENTVRAFNVTCPHAGCAVAYKSDQKAYLCPCHNSAFTLEGERSPSSPSARDLDALECKVENGEVWVKFQNFKAGDAHKIQT